MKGMGIFKWVIAQPTDQASQTQTKEAKPRLSSPPCEALDPTRKDQGLHDAPCMSRFFPLPSS